MSFDENIHCEEVYGPSSDDLMAQHLNEVEKKKVLFISPNLLILATVEDGKLTGAIGEKVKAEQIEMDYVKIEKGDQRLFVKLSDGVRWMEEME